MKLIKSLVRTGIFFAVSFLAVGCGGGTSGTGIMFIDVNGRVFDSLGLPAEGVNLAAMTQISDSQNTTENDGSFLSELSWRGDGLIEFEFIVDGETQFVPVDGIPADTRVLNIEFVFSEEGLIQAESQTFISIDTFNDSSFDEGSTSEIEGDISF